MLPILREPNPELRKKSTPVESDDLASAGTQKFLDDIVETMKVADGIGIAAPQVGVHKRIIIVQTANGPTPYINPKIISVSLRNVESEEGCLSIPGVFGIVKRRKKIKVKAFDRHGKKQILKASNLEAIVFQHEIDHLDGILFIDKVERFTNPPRL